VSEALAVRSGRRLTANSRRGGRGIVEGWPKHTFNRQPQAYADFKNAYAVNGGLPESLLVMQAYVCGTPFNRQPRAYADFKNAYAVNGGLPESLLVMWAHACG
jgi:hypothetical protein